MNPSDDDRLVRTLIIGGGRTYSSEDSAVEQTGSTDLAGSSRGFQFLIVVIIDHHAMCRWTFGDRLRILNEKERERETEIVFLAIIFLFISEIPRHNNNNNNNNKQ